MPRSDKLQFLAYELYRQKEKTDLIDQLNNESWNYVLEVLTIALR